MQQASGLTLPTVSALLRRITSANSARQDSFIHLCICLCNLVLINVVWEHLRTHMVAWVCVDEKEYLMQYKEVFKVHSPKWLFFLIAVWGVVPLAELNLIIALIWWYSPTCSTRSCAMLRVSPSGVSSGCLQNLYMCIRPCVHEMRTHPCLSACACEMGRWHPLHFNVCCLCLTRVDLDIKSYMVQIDLDIKS